MSLYRFAPKPGVVIVDGKKVTVDSQNEAQLIDWFERSGFSGLWRRPGVGAANGGSRYTGDFELSVLHEGKSRRAIVEAKPYKDALTPNIINRMRGVASYYKTDLLLLYARRENQWYRINLGNGSLTDYPVPVPGTVSIHKLPRPISLTSEKRSGKYYQRRLNPIGWISDLVIEILQGPKAKRRRRRR